MERKRSIQKCRESDSADPLLSEDTENKVRMSVP